MEPAFQRGDLLFLWNRDQRAEVGEIVVYSVKGKEVPIVHRIVRTFPDGVEGKKKKGKSKRYGIFLYFIFVFFFVFSSSYAGWDCEWLTFCFTCLLL